MPASFAVTKELSTSVFMQLYLLVRTQNRTLGKHAVAHRHRQPGVLAKKVWEGAPGGLRCSEVQVLGFPCGNKGAVLRVWTLPPTTPDPGTPELRERQPHICIHPQQNITEIAVHTLFWLAV